MIDTEKLSRLLEELNIAVDGYAAQRLDLYAQRLVAWNEKMNLTGITDPDGILEKHFIDSIEPLRFVEIPRNARVIDVGTGAGFPGLPLLIARPDLDLTCLLYTSDAADDIATARAVAPLPVLCEYCLPFVKVGGAFLALKGAEDEVATAKCAIATLGGELEQNVSYKLPSGDSRHLVVVRKISQTPTKYPRKPKKIDTKPL